MSARRATPEARCVWLTDDDFELTYAEFHRRARALRDAAPADPVATARSALTDCEYRSPGMGGAPEPIGDLYNPEGCRIVRAHAVLVALGYPVAGEARGEHDA